MGENKRDEMSSRSKSSKLRVEVPATDASTSSGQPSESNSGGTRRWGKVLQSPQALVEKTASFTAKLAGKMTNKASGTSDKGVWRTSVEPYRRAAIQAKYHTELELRKVRLRGK